MNIQTAVLVIDGLLWLMAAASVCYVFIFAMASMLPRRRQRRQQAPPAAGAPRFMVIYPAYGEDNVISKSVETFLRQDYPRDHYDLVVVSDHMKTETNQWLASQPVRLCLPQFEKSSKARALQYAIASVTPTAGQPYSHVVILDADNTVGSDFLRRLSEVCAQGHKAIQCHRTAKNSDSDIAVLDGVSEEINNSIFRRGHNCLGLSSALIGSGMCFRYEWFASHVGQLSTAGEDKELEAMLLKECIFIKYEEDIFVMDEKVSGGDNFQRQRLRWMTAQVQCLLNIMPWLPQAIVRGNINYIDKAIQQALIPRSILLALVTLLSMLSLFTFHFSIITAQSSLHILKWWTLLVMLVMALIVAIPAQLRSKSIFSKTLLLPQLIWRMVKNIVHIKPGNKEFLHTTHNS